MVHCPTLKGLTWVHLTFQVDFLYYIGIQQQVQDDILQMLSSTLLLGQIPNGPIMLLITQSIQ